MDKSIEKIHLYELVKDFEVAMLATHSGGLIHARPMVIARLETEMTAYLITENTSIKVEEINANSNALLTLQGARKFASVSGNIAVLNDRTLIELMWKEAWQVWFPKGKTDPSITLLKFTATAGEYWDNAGMQGLKYVYSAAKAFVSGEKPETSKEQHAKISI